MKIKFLRMLPFIILLAIGSCSDQVEKETSKMVQAEIEESWRQFIQSWEAEDAASCSQFYKADGINIPPDADPLKGRAAIEEFYNFLFSNHLSSKYMHTVESLDTSGNLAVEQGNFQVDWIRNDSTEWNFRARSMTLWVKGREGKWQIKKFFFNHPPTND